MVNYNKINKDKIENAMVKIHVNLSNTLANLTRHLYSMDQGIINYSFNFHYHSQIIFR